ncbi:alkanesulfonate monooxygenase SsuD/methylene tetrahydromethanopterin reductase-like flavin-dependent oxidoreductase (luciferase family) [Actinoplanes tereljensis]|uniref:Luciferase-like protein n=1 Tax=Paractinoplanes tereljensis TaxID=571912 RepID=A0A919NHD7_9ACTN|nr:LLM class flavin-dependent oxidoreductase [Actinoplanes tereljensis]GIF18026.1 luciferase-like protein [Actinoplanes tereljensis]
MALKFGVVLPGGNAREQLEQAVLAERSGWDGVFVWEAAYGVDAWSLLAAMAARTSRVRLGTMLTPLPWRRPWKLASQVATVDQLSDGRAILGVGVGAVDAGLPATGEPTDLRERAAMMDEGIDLIRALWSGARTFTGSHYVYTAPGDDLAEAVKPVQERIPIWVVAVWPRLKSMRRVLRCDGVIPGHSPTHDATREMRAWLTEHGSTADILAEGETPMSGGADLVIPWAEAGCTWWLETRWQAETKHEIRDRIAAGPPTA